MNIRKFWFVPLAAALGLCAVPAALAEDARCTLPGELIVEDAAGDDLLAPTGEGFADILSLHMSEPGDGSALVFTYKMAGLTLLPPNTVWVIVFVTDVPPATGNEYFVAMLTDPSGAVNFVHGTAAPVDAAQPAARLFTPSGALDAGSGFNADGTITLALNKANANGLEPGGFVFGFIPITHRITPTDGSQPFSYGIRGLTASPVQFAYDDAPDGFYEVAGKDACEAGKSSVLGVGALPPAVLLLLLLAPMLRRNKDC